MNSNLLDIQLSYNNKPTLILKSVYKYNFNVHLVSDFVIYSSVRFIVEDMRHPD